MRPSFYRFSASLSVAVVLGLAAPAVAQDGRQSETELLTRFVEEFRRAKGGKGDWKKSIKAFETLTKEYPIYKTERQHSNHYLNYAESLYNAKEPKRAAEELEKLLDREQDHIVALLLLAKIRAATAKNNKADLAVAKDHLLTGARNGLFVIREIQSKDNKMFKPLATDSKFILQVLQTGSDYRPSLSGLRNPFASPEVTTDVEGPVVGPGGPVDEIPPVKLDQIEREIDQLFEDIASLADSVDMKALPEKFRELNDLMDTYGRSGTEKVKEKLRDWKERLQDYKEVQVAIRLQVNINEGNRFLQNMFNALKEQRYDAVEGEFQNVKGLTERMKAEPRDEFSRNANVILSRAKKLAREATKQRKIRELRLDVTGIVIDDQPGSENRTIVNDKIYTEEEKITNEFDEVMEELEVVKIEETSVLFRFEDTLFRRLLPRPEAE